MKEIAIIDKTIYKKISKLDFINKLIHIPHKNKKNNSPFMELIYVYEVKEDLVKYYTYYGGDVHSYEKTISEFLEDREGFWYPTGLSPWLYKIRSKGVLREVTGRLLSYKKLKKGSTVSIDTINGIVTGKLISIDGRKKYISLDTNPTYEYDFSYIYSIKIIK